MMPEFMSVEAARKWKKERKLEINSENLSSVLLELMQIFSLSSSFFLKNGNVK